MVDNIAGPPGTIGESGFSALVEAFFSDSSSKKVLFDTGPSSKALINNCKILEVDFESIDAVVLSHGHWDHVGGLNEVISLIGKKVPLVCHPQALSPKYIQKNEKITDIGIQGLIDSVSTLREKTNLITVRKPYKFNDSLFTSGEVPRRNNFETLSGKLNDVTTEKDGMKIPDTIPDDLSLIFHLEDDSAVILCGCCHAGIVNTTARVAELTKSEKIIGIIGGLHLCDASHERLEYTVRELRQYPIKILAPCHCTGFRGKKALSEQVSKYFQDIKVLSKIEFTTTS